MAMTFFNRGGTSVVATPQRAHELNGGHNVWAGHGGMMGSGGGLGGVSSNEMEMMARQQAAWIQMNTQTQTPVVPKMPEKPAGYLQAPKVVKLEEYEDICDQLGFAPATLMHERLIGFLHDEKIKTYDLQKVTDYMTALAAQKGMRFYWCPLRAKDNALTFWGHRQAPTTVAQGYKHAVPIEHLRNARKIEVKFPGVFTFFVSDYQAVSPDPFIGCICEGGVMTVFGMWDEPGFGV